MTYLNFVLIFLATPLVLLMLLTWRDQRRGLKLPVELTNWLPWVALGGHGLVALLYTTPWDNYLVASRVWWYDPTLVSGIVFGWVPLEEYIFFILQPLVAGLWPLALARRLPVAPAAAPPYLRSGSTLAATGLWLGSLALLLSGWAPGTYLALELVWALPPIIVQLAFGADILWRHRRLVALSLLPAVIYLSAADALAINSGTWTINPELSLGIYLGGILPLEELLFFGLTNMLLVFGMILVLARQSQERVEAILKKQTTEKSSVFKSYQP